MRIVISLVLALFVMQANAIETICEPDQVQWPEPFGECETDMVVLVTLAGDRSQEYRIINTEAFDQPEPGPPPYDQLPLPLMMFNDFELGPVTNEVCVEEDGQVFRLIQWDVLPSDITWRDGFVNLTMEPYDQPYFQTSECIFSGSFEQ